MLGALIFVQNYTLLMITFLAMYTCNKGNMHEGNDGNIANNKTR
jgi:hypothetical protein